MTSHVHHCGSSAPSRSTDPTSHRTEPASDRTHLEADADHTPHTTPVTAEEEVMKEKMEEFFECHGGGIPGIETENGKATEMKIAVRMNIFGIYRLGYVGAYSAKGRGLLQPD